MCVKVLYQMFEIWCRDTHIWIVCVCAYALQEEEESWYLSIQVCNVPLEDEICTRCCFFTFEASFFQESSKQQLIQIKRVLQCNQANTNKGSYNLPLWLFHGKTSSSPHIDHSNKLNVDSILSSSHYKEIPRLKVFKSSWVFKNPFFELQSTYEKRNNQQENFFQRRMVRNYHISKIKLPLSLTNNALSQVNKCYHI